MNRFTIADHVEVSARSFPDRTAIEILAGPTATYSQLWRRAQALAGTLGHVEPGANGSMVGILLTNGIDAVAAYLACQLVEAAAVPVNTRLAPPEVDYVLRDSGASVVLSAGALLPEARRAADLAGLRLVDCQLVEAPDVDAERQRRERDVGEDIAAVFYTSGTTGFPKGAAMTNDSWLLRSMWWGWQFRMLPEDVMLVPGPIFHMSFGGLALSHLMLGGRLRIMEQFDADRAYEELSETCTFSFLVPSMSTMILERWRVHDHAPMNAARYILSSGAPLPSPILREMLDAFPNAAVADAYGWTEAGWVTCEVKARDTLRDHCVGWPAFGSEVVILDEERRPCPVGVAGEVAARSPVPFARYLNRDDATTAAWHGDYQVSGDVGILDDDGRIRIVDRKVDMIVSGGENVYTAEVERVLVEHAGVSECAVVGLADERWGEAVWAVVVPAPGAASLDADEVRQFCRGRLAGYKCPKHVLVVAELPRNSMGKVQKFRLRELVSAEVSVPHGR